MKSFMKSPYIDYVDTFSDYKDKEKKKTRKEISILYKKLRARVCVQLYKNFDKRKDDRESLEANAQDIAQDTITTYLTKREEGLVINNIEAWCTTVAKNKTIDFFRKKKAKRISDYSVSEEDENESKNFNTLERIYKDKRNDEASYYDILNSECMKQLNKNYRIALQHIMQGQKTREIAEILSIPQNTILTWVTKAKKQYSECMGLS